MGSVTCWGWGWGWDGGDASPHLPQRVVFIFSPLLLLRPLQHMVHPLLCSLWLGGGRDHVYDIIGSRGGWGAVDARCSSRAEGAVLDGSRSAGVCGGMWRPSVASGERWKIKNVIGILVPHLSWSSNFLVLLWQVHTHPMTTPTRSMARMAHSPPSPPPSAARLGQESIGSALLSAVGVSVFVPMVVEGPEVCCCGVEGYVLLLSAQGNGVLLHLQLQS